MEEGRTIKVVNTSYFIPGKYCSEYEWCFPTIHSVNARGRNMEWKIMVKLYDTGKKDFVRISEKYWQNGSMDEGIVGYIKVDSKIENGKVRDTDPTWVENGKRNTNVFIQSLRDANQQYNKYLKATVNLSADIELYPPMMAEVADFVNHPVDFTQPVFGQRKLNGIRCISSTYEGKVIMYSRQRKLFVQFDYLKSELAKPLDDWYRKHGMRLYLDGEIYLHGMSLQQISGLARREKKEQRSVLEYHVYDCFVPDRPETLFADRLTIIRDLLASHFQKVKLVETVGIQSQKDVDVYFRQFVSEGYEGLILRLNGPYLFGYHKHRSRDLLKVKPRQDYEFRVIGYTSGRKGKAADQLVMICETDKGQAFNVSIALGSDEVRRELLKLMSRTVPEKSNETVFDKYYKGKPIKVYFSEYSDTGVPQQPTTELEVRKDDFVTQPHIELLK